MDAYINIGKTKIKYLVIRVLAGLIIGSLCGVLGYAFHYAVAKLTNIRTQHEFVIYLMPAVGVLIVLMFKLLKSTEYSTSKVIENAAYSRPVTILLTPAVFIGTALTHFVGGSSGREGAAIQMGGSIGSFIARGLKLDEKHHRIAMLSGMGAFFTALFGTPVAATFFVMMVTFVGVTTYDVYLPVFISCITAYFVAASLGLEPTRYAITAPPVTVLMIIKVLILGALCGVVAILFYKTLHFAKAKFKLIKNEYLRILAGSVGIVLIILILGNDRYCGAGMEIIRRAVEEGAALPWDFVLKIILTAITLGCGFKGGEVIPSFFVGATFGAAIAPVLGMNPAFAAAIGLVAVFCAATNTIIPSIILAMELYSGVGIVFIALACTIACFVSGRDGLYACQEMLDENEFLKLFDARK